jgi:hypothetical protein
MKKIICQCLKTNQNDALEYFRIKAFATNAFLSRKRGGGEDAPIGSSPASGGGDSNGIEIKKSCP